MNFYKKTKIRKFLIIFIIFSIFIPSFLSTMFAYTYTMHTISNNYGNNYIHSNFEEIESSLSATLSKLTDYSIQFIGYKNIKNELIANQHSQKKSSDSIISFFDSILKSSDFIESIEFITSGGDRYFKGTDQVNLSVSDKSFFENLSSRYFRMTYLVDNGNIYYAFAKQIYSYDRNYIFGTIVFYVNESFFKTFTTSTSPSDVLFFISENDKIISHPDISYLGAKLYLPNDFMGYGKEPAANSNYTYATHTINNRSLENQLQITSILSNNAILSTMNKVIIFLILLLFFTTAIAVIIAVLLSRKLTYRISNLQNKMKDYIQDHDNFSEIVPSNEIGLLETNFNNMAHEITALVNNLKEEKEKQVEYEITALQSQINPHFIYNVLDSISWKAKQNSQYELDDMIVTLAKFFRIGLHKGESIINIFDEIEHVKSYLKIEKIRFPELFEVSYDIDDEILKYKTVKIILQPVVENAIKHAFCDLEQKPGHIKIKGYMSGTDICFEVYDDGCGMDFDNIPYTKSKGYGIRNVNKRIQLRYGSSYGITYSPNPEGKGTKATIKIKADLN